MAFPGASLNVFHMHIETIMDQTGQGDPGIRLPGIRLSIQISYPPHRLTVTDLSEIPLGRGEIGVS